MPVYNGNDPDSGLFGAAYYFQIHKLTESKNMTEAVIGFEGVVLDWYQTKEEHNQGLEWPWDMFARAV